MVAAFHASQAQWSGGALIATAPDRNEPLTGVILYAMKALFNGHGAVVMFFVISGFVLSLSLASGPQAATPAARRFFTARLLRIYPAVVATIVLFAIVYRVFGVALAGSQAEHYTAGGLLRHMLLLDFAINGVLWSLQLEVLAVPAIFLLYFVSRRWGPAPILALAIVLAGASFTKSYSRLLGADSPGLGLFYAFFIGMLVPSQGPRLGAVNRATRSDDYRACGDGRLHPGAPGHWLGLQLRSARGGDRLGGPADHDDLWAGFERVPAPRVAARSLPRADLV